LKRWIEILRTQLIVLAVTLLVGELALQLLARFTPVSRFLGNAPSLTIPDKRLGVRGNPRHPELDARGYRNVRALTNADVVVLGDSQAYGTWVARDDAWPALLAARTRLSVYNMALGGYSPAHSELQLPEALSLGPRAIVVSVYLGNDLFEAFSLARDWPVRPGLEDLAARAAALEVEESLSRKAMRLFQWRSEDDAVSLTRLRETLGHLMLYALARGVRNRLFEKPQSLSGSFENAVAALTPTDLLYVSVVDGPGWRTILRSPYRYLVLNQHDPRVLLGFERVVDALDSIAARCRSAGVDLLVVVIPTKESVFWPRVARPETHAQLRELVRDEDTVRAELLQRLRQAGVDIIDALPALRSAPIQPYFENMDGHPSPAGHRVIAELVTGWVIEHSTPRRSASPGPAAERSVDGASVVRASLI
jgi:lysophospholipase L1-like esterase